MNQARTTSASRQNGFALGHGTTRQPSQTQSIVNAIKAMATHGILLARIILDSLNPTQRRAKTQPRVKDNNDDDDDDYMTREEMFAFIRFVNAVEGAAARKAQAQPQTPPARGNGRRGDRAKAFPGARARQKAKAKAKARGSFLKKRTKKRLALRTSFRAWAVDHPDQPG